MWKPIRKENLGLLGGIQNIIQRLSDERPERFPDFSDDQTLLCASDYSGQHASATHEVYTFVFTTLRRWSSWERARKAIRGRLLLSRSMSFKRLNDSKRREALPAFLAAGSQLRAVTISVAVSKSVGSLFAERPVDTMKSVPFVGELTEGWKDSSAERLQRVLHFANLFTAGLSSPGQNVIWITDEDEIVANEKRLRVASSLSGIILSNLLDHDLGHIRLATTASDSGSLQLEDFVALADFTCGTVAEALAELEHDEKPTSSVLVTPLGSRMSPKSRWLVEWLSDDDAPNSQIVVAVDGSASGPLRIRRFWFHAITQPPIPTSTTDNRT